MSSEPQTTTSAVRLIGADVICAVVSLIAAMLVASEGNLLALAITSAFFGSSIAYTLSDWRFVRHIADLERRIDRLEALHRDVADGH